MVPELARESVIIKSGREHTTMLGNYECAYALGVLSQISGIAIDPAQSVQEVYESFVPQIAQYKAANDQERRIIEILMAYKPNDVMNDDVTCLYHMGLEEKKLWSI